MYAIDPRSSGKSIWFRTGGRVTKEDTQSILKAIERRIKEHGQVRVLWEMEAIETVSPSAIWEDLKFDMKHRKDYERIAMVGDANWQETMTKLSKPFFEEVKWFSAEECEEAWNWLIR